jgi:hypothetical protein
MFRSSLNADVMTVTTTTMAAATTIIGYHSSTCSFDLVKDNQGPPCTLCYWICLVPNRAINQGHIATPCIIVRLLSAIPKGQATSHKARISIVCSGCIWARWSISLLACRPSISRQCHYKRAIDFSSAVNVLEHKREAERWNNV